MSDSTIQGSSDSSFRFETYVVGGSNRLAVSAARAVAEAPGASYNPLFIYGGSGLGKTHLVAAIAHHARANKPALRVEFTTGEELAERFHRAIASGQQASFGSGFHPTDLLVLDDVQFLTGQRETQSELLRMFNQMQGTGRQLVMTSDRPLSEISDVDQRLLSRLSGGLVVDVGAPDYEMRLAILRNSCAEKSVDVPAGVLEEIARLPVGNVRELKGALNRVLAYQQLEGTTIDVADVRAVLLPAGGSAAPVVTAGATNGVPDIAGGEYEGFLADVVEEVETRVERWRVHLGEACTYWRGEGYATAVLERAMALPAAPDVNGLLTMYSAAIDHLRALEMRALALDPSLRGNAAFRSPEMIAEAQSLVDRATAVATPLPMPLALLTRATMEVGSANQFALKAFDAVVEHPSQRYNPLVVYGPHGTGKTHFAHAIANAMHAAWPRKTIACLSAAHFVEELVAAMQEGSIERWRARYRAADVLVIDDVQSIGDKERTQDELFHLFNHLSERGAQIVLTADRQIREIKGLADRLRSRFEGGLVVSLAPPDRSLRERIVHRALVEGGHEASQSLVAFLADRESKDLREVTGMMTRLTAAAQLHGATLTLEMAHRELGFRITPPMSGGDFVPRAPGLDALDDFFMDTEKTIWDWPELANRVIEELR